MRSEQEPPPQHFPQCVGMHTSDNGAAAWELFFEAIWELAATARQREAVRLQAKAKRETPQETAQEGQ